MIPPLPAVALCNYRYFVSGGPERYMFAVESLLSRRGHKVVPFAAHYPQNRPTPFARYFVSAPASGGTVYFEEHSRSLANVLHLVARCFYCHEAKTKLQHLIRAERIDVAYVLQHHNVLSPSIIVGAKELGRRVVLRLSDFSLLCPAYHFQKRGRPCEACFHGLWRALPGRCTKSSLGATVIRVASMYFHRARHFYNHVDAFVAPTQFLREKMIRGGYPAGRIHHIPTFVEPPLRSRSTQSPKHILYLGRLSPEKGVEQLLRGYSALSSNRWPLRIVGEGPAAEVERLKSLATQLALDTVEFCGFKSGTDTEQLIDEALFVVVPSVCYENLPNALLEAFARGKPVLASRLGSLPEAVEHGVTGLLFEPWNPGDLAAKMDALLSDPKRARELGHNARSVVDTRFSSDLHYARLAELFGNPIPHN